MVPEEEAERPAITRVAICSATGGLPRLSLNRGTKLTCCRQSLVKATPYLSCPSGSDREKSAERERARDEINLYLQRP